MKERAFPLGNRPGGAKAGARGAPPGHEATEAIAVAALAYLGQNIARIDAFLQAVGMNPYNLREIAARPEFLAGVLDYLAQHEKLLADFAAETGHDPLTMMQARAKLAGGDAWDST